MEKLLDLISLCKCSVSIVINNHKDFYQTVDNYISEIPSADIVKNIGVDVYDEIIKRDNIVEITAYPNTPIGFYYLCHYDLETAINIMLDNLKQN